MTTDVACMSGRKKIAAMPGKIVCRIIRPSQIDSRRSSYLPEPQILKQINVVCRNEMLMMSLTPLELGERFIAVHKTEHKTGVKKRMNPAKNGTGFVFRIILIF